MNMFWKRRNTIWPGSIIIITMILLAIGCIPKTSLRKADGRFYFDSVNGDDKNDGSQSNPWQTLSKINKINLFPGDSIFLKGGTIFSGSIVLEAIMGTRESTIVVTSYGDKRAIVSSDDDVGISVKGCNYLTIENLEFKGSGRATNTASGVYLMKSQHILLKNLETSGYLKSGVAIHESNDVKVTHTYAHDNGFAGITSMGGIKQNQNIYIGYSKAERNLGDRTVLDNHSGSGILIGYSDNVVVEYCTASENGAEMPRGGNGPVGIWAHDGDNVLFQYNISHHNRTNRALGGLDGGGFDFDGAITNSMMQYCLSYENEGAGYGIFQYKGAGLWSNNTIRFCISENDGRALRNGEGGGFFLLSAHDEANFEKFYCYNNVVFNDQMPAIGIYIDAGAVKYRDFHFYNNILYTVGVRDAIAGTLNKKTESFMGNLWYDHMYGFNVDGHKTLKAWANQTGQETLNGKVVGLSTDPCFNNFGNFKLTAPTLLHDYNNYRLKISSPALGTGLDLRALFGFDIGTQDFYGNSLKKKDSFNVGVFGQ